MPNATAGTWLELPPGLAGLSQDAQMALNDRLRTIAARLDSVGASTGSGTAPSSGSELILSVPGTLGVRTNAAPLVSFSAAVTPTGLVAMVKKLPQGASIIVNVLVAGVAYTSVTIAPGSSAPVIVTGGLGGAIAANALVTLNIVQVGTVFPGADLSVLLRF